MNKGRPKGRLLCFFGGVQGRTYEFGIKIVDLSYCSHKCHVTPMKYLFTLLFSVISLLANAQYAIYENFEAPYDAFRANFYIDTVNCANNIWQIGRPQKTVFDSALSFPNAIVTDTLNPIPPHDTSIFYLTTVGAYRSLSSISFYYKIDKDTNSFAKIEISGDAGLNWINPLTEDTTYNFYWVNSKPRIDTSTTGWRYFWLNMDYWSMADSSWGLSYPHYRTSDTMMYRFTFISGDSVEAHDGWIMDNFKSENTLRVGILDITSSKLLLYPNPSSGEIKISTGAPVSENDRIMVYDVTGREVYRTNLASSTIHLPVPDGIYTLKYIGKKEAFVSKLAIRR
jgi:hypothetical protein